MNTSANPVPGKSRLRIVLETFAGLGVMGTWAVRSIIPFFVAGVLFSICALAWRTDAQRKQYPTAWVTMLLVGFIAATVTAVYLRK